MKANIIDLEDRLGHAGISQTSENSEFALNPILYRKALTSVRKTLNGKREQWKKVDDQLISFYLSSKGIKVVQPHPLLTRINFSPSFLMPFNLNPYAARDLIEILSYTQNTPLFGPIHDKTPEGRLLESAREYITARESNMGFNDTRGPQKNAEIRLANKFLELYKALKEAKSGFNLKLRNLAIMLAYAATYNGISMSSSYLDINEGVEQLPEFRRAEARKIDLCTPQFDRGSKSVKLYDADRGLVERYRESSPYTSALDWARIGRARRWRFISEKQEPSDYKPLPKPLPLLEIA